MKKLPFNSIVLNAWRAKIGDPKATPNPEEDDWRILELELPDEGLSSAMSRYDDYEFFYQVSGRKDKCCHSPSICHDNDCERHNKWLEAEEEKEKLRQFEAEHGLCVTFISLAAAQRAVENIRTGQRVSLGIQAPYPEDTILAQMLRHLRPRDRSHGHERDFGIGR